MANAAILYQNLADTAIVTASSWIAAAPPQRLQNPHVRRRWKGNNSDTEYLIVDFGVAVSIDTVALFGLQGVFGDTQRNLGATTTSRVRISLADETGLDGDQYDSEVETGLIREAYAALVKALPSAVFGRYVRIDLSSPGAAALLAGRLVIGSRHSFTINFSYDWSSGTVDPSRKKKSAAGQTFVEREDKYRVLAVSFGSLDEADRYGFVEAADIFNGVSDDVLFFIDPQSEYLDRDAIWGLMTDLAPTTQPNLAFFSKSYSFEERR